MGLSTFDHFCEYFLSSYFFDISGSHYTFHSKSVNILMNIYGNDPIILKTVKNYLTANLIKKQICLVDEIIILYRVYDALMSYVCNTVHLDHFNIT